MGGADSTAGRSIRLAHGCEGACDQGQSREGATTAEAMNVKPSQIMPPKVAGKEETHGIELTRCYFDCGA
jgi:hypothetical protein